MIQGAVSGILAGFLAQLTVITNAELHRSIREVGVS
ncbi:hypothetical protein EMEDMD4_90107 [Sinorhizobium medicae]|uniref:Uncharacterized protein n=1 Tax=Sinorhizobium medicae TaxID=110321 RepID=A0A508XBA6_9HYPH|nr:hypothetical protein EMEDMD4_90107 [Sinorhizobium medicae]